VDQLEQSNRAVVPGHCVRLSGERVRVDIPGQKPPGEPRVEVVRQGEVIRLIDITCACGQHIRLHCDYQA
jgi:hypothetical protein